MRITKRQLRRIIKEERHRLVREMNPDGTVSADEDNERELLTIEVEERLNALLDYVISEADRIGGGFRSPGIRKEVLRLMANMIHSYR